MSFYLPPSDYSLEHVLGSPCSLLGLRSLGEAMSVLYFLYLVGPYPWNVGNVCFAFLLCVIALCMMYVYVCVCVCLFMDDCALCMMDSCDNVSDLL